jgi:cytochrome c-type biogenesis protein CcmH
MKRAPFFIRFVNYALLCFFVAAAVITFQPVRAQQPIVSDDEVNAIARQMFCPICENIPLDVCPTDACRDWRELIRQMLAQGKTPNEIKEYFVDHYGARVLSEPPRSGVIWLIYVIPPLAILIGAFLLFWAFRTWIKIPKRPKAEVDFAAPDPAGKNEYASRFEEELRKRE